MAKKLIDTSTLTSIADAIREKDGSTDAIQVSDFASAISNIPSGSGCTLYEDSGIFVLDADTRRPIIEHNLGMKPQYVEVSCNEETIATDSMVNQRSYLRIADFIAVQSQTYKSTNGQTSIIYPLLASDENTFQLQTNSSSRTWRAGYEYSYRVCCGIEFEEE